MLSPQLRQRVFDLWTSFWSSGMTNPITAIEQITYLLFLQRLEALDRHHQQQGKLSLYEPDHQECRWSYISSLEDPTKAHDVLTQQVFPWLRSLNKTIRQKWGEDKEEEGVEVAEYLEDAYFQLPREKTSTLRKALQTVENLFAQVGTRSANADLMGDIFEYLLDELRTAGKNGQFRTPRHIIRFMIELLDPEPGTRIIDPAAGTGGFLINTILHHRTRITPSEQLRLEWDGTPHRLEPASPDMVARDLFTGFDNDRTMVRIGWMNLILHGVSNPRFIQTDPLSRSLPKEESNSYDYALANPPYSGSVDRGDLHPERFPRKKNTKNEEPISDRTELLFVWLMLDLLKPGEPDKPGTGGRMAVIVPEGLLFGSAGAHRELRRQLLFQHEVEGVISLPQGVFQPYTGVKTSILIVRKGPSSTPDESKHSLNQDAPRTRQVWFYEVASDGYTLGAERAPQYRGTNDLWDALEKWRRRDTTTSNKDYWQPQIYRERWRLVDETLASLFPNTPSIQEHLGEIQAAHELFPEWYRTSYTDPDTRIPHAENLVVANSQVELEALLLRVVTQQTFARVPLFDPKDMTARQREDSWRRLRSLLLGRDSSGILERREGPGTFSEEHGRAVLGKALDVLKEQVTQYNDVTRRLWQEARSLWDQVRADPTISPDRLRELLLPFAMLDGYDVYLRSHESQHYPNGLTDAKSWTAPVRVWRQRPEWVSPVDPAIEGSHDSEGNVRPEYVAAARDPKTGLIRPEFLDSDCIEANDFNLSAGRYKPPVESLAEVSQLTVTDLIHELRELERNIQTTLEQLIAVVEGRA